MSDGIIIRGEDGVAWDLFDGFATLLPAGVRGLHFPPMDVYSRATPARAGRRRTGSRYIERPVMLPLDLGGDILLAAEFRAQEAAFWQAFAPGRSCTLEVTVGGVTRTLRIIPDSDGAGEFETDPFEQFAGRVLGYETLLEATADRPFWQGTPFVQNFDSPTDAAETFPLSESDDYVLYLTPANTTGAGTLTNPGDVPAWPKYTIRGPLTSFSITVGGKIAGSFTIPSGATLIIDTDPSAQTAILSSAPGTGNVTRDLDDIDFRPIPKGSSVPISVVLNGEGSMTVELTPDHLRAWG